MFLIDVWARHGITLVMTMCQRSLGLKFKNVKRTCFFMRLYKRLSLQSVFFASSRIFILDFIAIAVSGTLTQAGSINETDA